MSLTAASVIVRCRDEARNIEACLRSLRAQTVGTEIVLVDSGSTDATVELARPLCDRIVHLPSQEFSFGRALNLGVRHAQGEILFALSAHCVAPDTGWVERSLVHYRDQSVAGVSGAARLPDGQLLDKARSATFDDVRADPHWGFSNHASSWRRSAWEVVPFRETAKSCEDKLWMWTVMLAGWKVVLDPRVVVSSEHRRAAGIRSLWRREVAEHAAVAAALDFPLRTRGALFWEWWDDFPWPSERPKWQRRLNPWRATELLAGALGDRLGARRRGASTLSLPMTPCLPVEVGLPARHSAGSDARS